jgi:hypothetical protein
MTPANAAIQSWYTEQLRSFWAARFQAYLDGSDPHDERYPRQKELGDAAVQVDSAAVQVDREKEWTALPREVREAVEYYVSVRPTACLSPSQTATRSADRTLPCHATPVPTRNRLSQTS